MLCSECRTAHASLSTIDVPPHPTRPHRIPPLTLNPSPTLATPAASPQTVFNPEEVKTFLMDAKLPDPRPLIHVCDRFDFIDEMTAYLYRYNKSRFILS